MSVAHVHISGASSIDSGTGDVVAIAFIGTVIDVLITNCGSGNIVVTVAVVVAVIPGHSASVAAAITSGDVAAIIGNFGHGTDNFAGAIRVGVAVISGYNVGIINVSFGALLLSSPTLLLVLLDDLLLLLLSSLGLGITIASYMTLSTLHWPYHSTTPTMSD